MHIIFICTYVIHDMDVALVAFCGDCVCHVFAAKVALLQVHQSWQAIGWCSPSWENNCRFASQSRVAFFFLLSIQQQGRGMRPELANFSALPEAGSLHSWLDGHIVGNGGLPFWTVAKGDQSKQPKI